MLPDQRHPTLGVSLELNSSRSAISRPAFCANSFWCLCHACPGIVKGYGHECACGNTGEGVQHPSAHDKYNCGQKLMGTVSIPFVELQLADGEMVVFEEIGWGPYRTSCHNCPKM